MHIKTALTCKLYNNLTSFVFTYIVLDIINNNDDDDNTFEHNQNEEDTNGSGEKIFSPSKKRNAKSSGIFAALFVLYYLES